MPGRILRRIIEAGMSYTVDEEERDEIELRTVEPFPEPPVEIQGEPWGWTKPGRKPLGWREDGRYDGS